MQTITKNEAELLNLALHYDSRENQLSDNYSRATVADAHRIMGSQEAGAGLIGSLVKKGLVLDPAEHGGDPNPSDTPDRWPAEQNMIWLTQAGVNAIFDWREEEGA